MMANKTETAKKSMEKSSEPAIGSQEWVRNWMEERKVHRMNKAKSLKDLAAYLRELGYKYIRVWYEGAGDSGECFHAEGWKEEINLESKDSKGYYPDIYQSKRWNYDKEEDFDEWKGMTRNQRDLEKSYDLFRENHPDRNLNSELHYELVEIVDYDWYNNEGGQGEVVWDLQKEEFRVDGQQNRYAAVDVKETYFMNGMAPETWYGDEVYER
tara:strand:- start:356 stop:991 length:636 start_codon:yes stop_codon:yes gene_type:complete